MLARGWLSLHTPPFPGRKCFAAKSRISISSKLIENKRFQVLYFGHLRKTGGRGSYRLVHTTDHPVRKSPPLTPAFPALARPLPNLIIFNELQSIGGRGSGHTMVRSQTGPLLKAAATQTQRPHIQRRAGIKASGYIGE